MSGMKFKGSFNRVCPDRSMTTKPVAGVAKSSSQYRADKAAKKQNAEERRKAKLERKK
jgi:hypothetical protein